MKKKILYFYILEQPHEIRESITIIDLTQLLFLTPEKKNNIKSIRIENQVIDNEVREVTAIFTNKIIEQVYFVNCSFLDDGLTILSEFPNVSKIGLIQCNLSYDELENLLLYHSPYHKIKILDLTGNELAKAPKHFVDIFERVIFPYKAVEELILVDNGLDEYIISLIKGEINCSIEKIHI